MGPVAHPTAPVAMPTPLPIGISPSPFMISALPSIAASLDGPQKQFYTARALPRYRVSLPL
jgi:hypothetical protein